MATRWGPWRVSRWLYMDEERRVGARMLELRNINWRHRCDGINYIILKSLVVFIYSYWFIFISALWRDFLNINDSRGKVQLYRIAQSKCTVYRIIYIKLCNQPRCKTSISRQINYKLRSNRIVYYIAYIITQAHTHTHMLHLMQTPYFMQFDIYTIYMLFIWKDAKMFRLTIATRARCYYIFSQSIVVEFAHTIWKRHKFKMPVYVCFESLDNPFHARARVLSMIDAIHNYLCSRCVANSW